MPVHGRRVGLVSASAVVAAALLVVSGCGSGKGSGTSGSAKGGNLPAVINLVSVKDLTGPAAFAGTSADEGIALAIEQINKEQYLGSGTALKSTSKDTANSAQTAASAVTEAIADRNVSAILGPVSSGQAVAVAPIAEKAKMPIVFTQSGSDGTVIGKYTFRATAPQGTFYYKAAEYLQQQNAKKLSIVYNSGSPTLVEMAEKILPSLKSKYGFDIVATSAVQLTTQDFTSPISKALAAKPDAVAVLMIGAQNPTAMTQLRQAGFNGPVIGNSGAGAGNLAPAGPAGAGMTWPVDFNYNQTKLESKKFVELYKAKYNKNPLNYAAEGYDAVWWIARAIKAGGASGRDDIQKGLDKVAAEGFDGAMGKLTFDGRDLRVAGVLVQWDGKEEKLLKE